MMIHSLKKQFIYTIVLSTDHVTHCNDFVIMQQTHEYYNIFTSGQLFPAVVILYMAKHFNRLVRMKNKHCGFYLCSKTEETILGKSAGGLKIALKLFHLKVCCIQSIQLATYKNKQLITILLPCKLIYHTCTQLDNFGAILYM